MENYSKQSTMWLIEFYIGNVNGVMNAVITHSKPLVKVFIKGRRGPRSNFIIIAI